MRCQVCDKEFISLEWFKDDNIKDTKLICCDECVLYILKARYSIKSNELINLRNRIELLENN